MTATGPAASLVVFDLDGTLVDSVRDIAAAVNAALASVAPDTAALPVTAIHTFVGDGAAVLIAKSLRAAGLAHRVEEVLPLYLDEYRHRLLATTTFFPGVREALAALAGHTLAVLTNKPGDLSRALLAGLGEATRFARIWGGGDVPGKKPDPTGLQRLMAELGARASETVMVGDSAVDVATGRAAGVATVGVSYGLDPEGLAAARPDRLLADLRELPAFLDKRKIRGLADGP